LDSSTDLLSDIVDDPEVNRAIRAGHQGDGDDDNVDAGHGRGRVLGGFQQALRSGLRHPLGEPRLFGDVTSALIDRPDDLRTDVGADDPVALGGILGRDGKANLAKADYRNGQRPAHYDVIERRQWPASFQTR